MPDEQERTSFHTVPGFESHEGGEGTAASQRIHRNFHSSSVSWHGAALGNKLCVPTVAGYA